MEIIRNLIRDIRPEYWVALGAAVSILSLMVAGFSLIYVRRSAKGIARADQTAKAGRQGCGAADVVGRCSLRRRAGPGAGAAAWELGAKRCP